MSVVFVGDSHFGARNDSHFYLEKQVEFYDKLINYIKDEKNEKVSAIIHLGDFFDDRREINIYVFNVIEKILDKLELCKIPNYFILGNHDVYYKNDNSINMMVPILKNYKNLFSVENPIKLNFDNKKFALIPWINTSNLEEMQNFVNELTNDYYILGHFGFSEMTAFSKSQDLLESKNFKHFKEVISGHYHLRLQKDNILFLGSIIDFKWQEELTNHGFLILHNNETKEFIDNEQNIHQKFFVEALKDFDYILDNCENKEIKIVLSNNVSFTNKEYDHYISLIDQKSNSLNVVLSNDAFSTEDEKIEVKTFEEFLKQFFDNKTFNNNISNEKLYKIILNLYNSTKE